MGKKEKEKLSSDKIAEINLKNDRVNNNIESEVPTKAQRTIVIATAVVQINKNITTPVRLEIRPYNCASNLNVAQTLKLIEPTVNL